MKFQLHGTFIDGHIISHHTVTRGELGWLIIAILIPNSNSKSALSLPCPFPDDSPEDDLLAYSVSIGYSQQKEEIN